MTGFVLMLLGAFIIGCLFRYLDYRIKSSNSTGRRTLPDDPGFQPAQGGFLLTRAEWAFYEQLRVAIPAEFAIWSKARLWDVVQTTRHDRPTQNKMMMKHLDFVITTYGGRIYAAVELDDSSHDAPERRERDRFVDDVMRQAGIRLVRVRVAAAYDLARLRTMILS